MKILCMLLFAFAFSETRVPTAALAQSTAGTEKPTLPGAAGTAPTEAAQEAWWANAWAWLLVPGILGVLFLVWFVPLSTSSEADHYVTPEKPGERQDTE
jgi:hypothetical protein